MQGATNKNLEEITRDLGAQLIPLHLAFKRDAGYLAFEVQGEELIPLYRDNNHLSPQGSLRAAQFIITQLFPEPTNEESGKAPPCN